MERAGFCRYGSLTRIVKAPLASATEDPARCVLRAVASKVERSAALAIRYFAACAAIGILGLALFGGAGSTASAVGRLISAMVGGMLVALGLRSLLNAPDPEASPPKWMEKNSRAITVVLCFVFGAFFLLGGIWILLDTVGATAHREGRHPGARRRFYPPLRIAV
jgi:hypothetical protein